MDNRRHPNVIVFYIYYFFAHFLPLYAVYLLIVNNTLKSEIQTSVLIALWGFTVVVLEIPSGVLADYWNKKNVLIIGQAAKFIACIIWMLSTTFFMFAIGFVLWGISESFCSGAIESLLFEELEHHQVDDKYQQVSGHCRFLMTAGITIAFLSGGILNENGKAWVFYISFITATISLIAAIFIPHYHIVEGNCERSHFRETLFDALKQIRETSLLLRILLYCIIYLSIIGTIEEYLQLWLFESNVKGFFYGGALTMIMLSQMIGTGLSSFLIVRKRMEIFLYSGMLICGLLLIIGYCNTYISMATILCIFLITGIMETKLEAFVQESIIGQRSTIFSINSFAMNITAIIISLIIGIISEKYSFRLSFAVLGFIIVLSVFYLFYKYDRSKVVGKGSIF